MTKQENRTIIVKQTREVIRESNKHKPAVEVVCTCGVKKNILYMYKCLYCGIFFCKKCAQEHFEKETKTEGIKMVEISNQELVGVLIREDGKVVWINDEKGEYVFRASRIGELILNDERKEE